MNDRSLTAADIRREKNDRWFFAFGLLYLTLFIFDSPIRWGLSMVGAEAALYVRDVGAIVVIFAYIARELLFGFPTPALGLLYFLGLSALYSFLQLNSLAQPIVGLKIALPVILGAALYTGIRARWKNFKIWLYVVWMLSLVGVFVNYFFDMPWLGATFQSALGESSISREWTTAGIRRLSGFSRASYDAAAICSVGAAVFLVDSKFGRILRLTLYSASLLAVGLTTSKGPLLAMLAVLIWFGFRSIAGLREMSPAVFFISALSFLVPPALYIYHVRFDNSVYLLSSFVDRVNWMWPTAFMNMQHWVEFIVGRGIGGIGFAQYFGESVSYNAADNFGVYIFVSFGLVGVVLFFFMLLRFARTVWREAYCSHHVMALRSLLVFWLFCGVVSNMYEQPVLAFVFGLFVGFSFSRRVSVFD